MRKHRYLLSALACVFLMTACSGSKEEPEKPVSQDTISITDEAGQAVTTLKASATNAPINLSVTANFDWAASSGDTWARLSPESGKSGTTRLTLTLDAHTGTTPRSTTLSFKKNGALKAKISLVQEGGGSVVPTYRSLKLRQSNINQMTFTESNGTYSISTTGTDPYVFTELLDADLASDLAVVAFEYTATKDIDDMQLFFCPPMSEERSEHYGKMAKASSWKDMSLPVMAIRKKFGWGASKHYLRLDFGHTDNNTLQLRNLRVRPFTDAERAAYEEQEGKDADKEVVAEHLKTYLKASYAASVTHVSVTADKVTVQGTAPGSGNYSLAEIMPYDNLTEMKSFPNKQTLSSSTFNVTFDRKVTRDGFTYDRALSRWAVVQTSGSSQALASHARYADEIAAPSSPAAVSPRSKKGLGGYFAHSLQTGDLDNLGITSVTVNIVLNRLINTASDGNYSEAYSYGGKTYYISSSYRKELDDILGQCQQRGIVTEAILLVATAGTTAASSLMKHPECTGGHYSMPNMTTAAAVNLYAASLDYLAKRYSQASPGRIHHWILHNEVDFGKEWTNMGEQPELCYMDAYVKSMRLCSNIARQYDSNAAVLISLTHCWTKADGQYAPKSLLEDLKGYSAAEGDFWWGIAHHPYPQNLTLPEFWKNDTQATYSRDSKYVTFKNLEVIDDWIRTPANLYKGTTKRLLFLSENGTNSPSYSDTDLAKQAAGAAWALKKVFRLQGIDAIQWHNWWDNPAEDGLHIGLRRNDGKNPSTPKPVWDVWKAGGTASENTVFAPYLSTIGIASWEEIFHNVE